MKYSSYLENSAECSNCSINELCKALNSTATETAQVQNIGIHQKALKKSEALFYAGEKLSHIYAIRKGSVKTFCISQDGEEQITGFHHAGEVLGLDALARQKHHSFAKALETTEVCAIPYEKFDELATQTPKLHNQLMNVMSNEIAKQYDQMLNLNQRAADQRLANFLINLHKLAEQNTVNEINLNMTRGEIANHLGLALETVSRLFSKFKKHNIIELQCKQVKIIDLPTLKNIAGIEEITNTIDAMAA